MAHLVFGKVLSEKKSKNCNIFDKHKKFIWTKEILLLTINKSFVKMCLIGSNCPFFKTFEWKLYKTSKVLNIACNKNCLCLGNVLVYYTFAWCQCMMTLQCLVVVHGGSACCFLTLSVHAANACCQCMVRVHSHIARCLCIVLLSCTCIRCLCMVHVYEGSVWAVHCARV